MNLPDNSLYAEDIRGIAALLLPWEKLKNRAVLISGASGLVGSCLVDVLMYLNKTTNLNCKVYAMARNVLRAQARFEHWRNEKTLELIAHDINTPLCRDDWGQIAYVLHLASNTHPIAYATDPIGTITTNILGTKHMLDFAVSHHAERVVFASSNEIYGQNRSDAEKFSETYCGYIDSNTLRAGYPESKRCGEALCQAYRSQYGLNVVIPRLTRSYGPSMLMSDTKAISQFLRKAIDAENIVLKSAGTQYYSYTYVADAVSGLLTVLLLGKDGEAYNISDEASDIRLKDLAELIAKCAGTQVVYAAPNEIERAGFSKADKARLDNSKLCQLNWHARYPISEGVERTLAILRDMR